MNYKRIVKRYGLPALAALAVLVGSGCQVPPVVAQLIPPALVRASEPEVIELAASIPVGSTAPNHAVKIRTHGVNWGYPAGSILRLPLNEAHFVANHGGYTLIQDPA